MTRSNSGYDGNNSKNNSDHSLNLKNLNHVNSIKNNKGKFGGQRESYMLENVMCGGMWDQPEEGRNLGR